MNDTDVMLSVLRRERNNVSKDATLVTVSHKGNKGLDIEFFKHETIRLCECTNETVGYRI